MNTPDLNQLAEQAAKEIKAKFDGEYLNTNKLTSVLEPYFTKATEALENKMCELIEDTKITEPEGSPISRLVSLCSWAKLRHAKSRAAPASAEQPPEIRNAINRTRGFLLGLSDGLEHIAPDKAERCRAFEKLLADAQPQKERTGEK